MLIALLLSCQSPTLTFGSPVDDAIDTWLFTEGAMPGFERYGDRGCAIARSDGTLQARLGTWSEPGGFVVLTQTFDVEWRAGGPYLLELIAPAPFGKVGEIAIDPGADGYWLVYSGPWATGMAAWAVPVESCGF